MGPVNVLKAKTHSLVGNQISIPWPSCLHPSRSFCCRLSHDLPWRARTSCVRSTIMIRVTDRRQWNWEWITCWKDKSLTLLLHSSRALEHDRQVVFRQWSLVVTVTGISHQSVLFVLVFLLSPWNIFACSFYLLDYLIFSLYGWCINNNVIVVIKVPAECMFLISRQVTASFFFWGGGVFIILFTRCFLCHVLEIYRTQLWTKLVRIFRCPELMAVMKVILLMPVKTTRMWHHLFCTRVMTMR